MELRALGTLGILSVPKPHLQPPFKFHLPHSTGKTTEAYRHSPSLSIDSGTAVWDPASEGHVVGWL